MMLLLSIVLVILSGICKAVADTVKHHYDTSIFMAKKSGFWLSDGSNKYKNGDAAQGRKYPAMFDGFTDAWHVFNNAAFYLLIVAIAVAYTAPFIMSGMWLLKAALIAAAGITLHMQTFNIFYNRILRKKPPIFNP